jgi:hypothetical protein
LAIRIQKLAIELTTTRSPRPGEPILRKAEAGALPRQEARARALAGASTGSPVPSGARRALAPVLGPIPHARVHTGTLADQAARSVGAQAFTLGSDIFFRAGRYNPGSAGGLALLGHELTHVQQGARGIARKADGAPGTDRFEAEAERNEARIRAALSGAPAPRGRGTTLPPLASSPARARAIRRSPLPGSAGSAAARPVAPAAPRAGRVRITSLRLVCSGFAGLIRRKGIGAELASPFARGKGGSGSLSESITRSRGTALPSAVRSVLEPAFGQSFADVRVHTGGEAARAARSVNAQAFTLGSDVFFNAGFFEPASPRGIALIGHELTHVAQNRGAARSLVSGEVRRSSLAGGSPLGGALAAADAVSHAVSAQTRFLATMLKPAGELAFRVLEKFETSKKLVERAEQGADLLHKTHGFLSRMIGMSDAVSERAGGAFLEEIAGKLGSFKSFVFENPLLKRILGPLIALHGAFDHLKEMRLGPQVLQPGAWTDPGRHHLALGTDQGRKIHTGYWAPVLSLDAVSFASSVASLLSGGTLALFGGTAATVAGTAAKVWAGSFSKAPTPEPEAPKPRTEGFFARMGRKYDEIVDTIEASRFRRAQKAGLGVPLLELIHRKAQGIELAGHDSYEDQALTNERTILRAFKRGVPLTRLPATPGGGGGGAPVRRKNWLTDWLDENKRYWDDVGEKGVTEGGAWGYTKAGFAALASSVNDPGYVYRQSKAYVQGFGIGAYDGVKGMVNMVAHPIKTGEGMYQLVIHWDQAKAGLSARVRLMLDHASSDPELFAKECGELAGQIDVALIGPKAVGGAKEVAGFLKTTRNIVGLPGKTLWYYSDAASAASIEASSTIGKGGAAFATALDPLLGGSRSLMGILARNIFLGGRLDFVVKAGKLLKFIPKMGMTLKPAFTNATGFVGGAFRPILLTSVETGLLRAAKTISGFQYAAETPQQVTILARQILTNPTTAHTFFQAADMLQPAGTVLVGTDMIPLDDIAKTDWSHVQPDEATRQEHEPHRKRRGATRFEDDDPELVRRIARIRRRQGDRPGDSLELSTKHRLERVLGRELGEVRVHSGPFARALTDATEAQALTIGRDIFLPGSLDLGTPEGLGLLAHEATHVAQIGPASPTASPRSIGGGLGIDAMERAAHSVERRAVAGARALGGYSLRAPEPVHREAPLAPETPRAPLPVAAAAPGPVSVAASASSPVARQPVGSSHASTGPAEDAVQEIMNASAVGAGVTPEEFMQICTGRILELMKEELEVDNMRRETLAWTYDAPGA